MDDLCACSTICSETAAPNDNREDYSTWILRMSQLQDVIALGDYDGVITQMHTLTGHSIWMADDHDGARWVLDPVSFL